MSTTLCKYKLRIPKRNLSTLNIADLNKIYHKPIKHKIYPIKPHIKLNRAPKERVIVNKASAYQYNIEPSVNEAYNESLVLPLLNKTSIRKKISARTSSWQYVKDYKNNLREGTQLKDYKKLVKDLKNVSEICKVEKHLVRNVENEEKTPRFNNVERHAYDDIICDSKELDDIRPMFNISRPLREEKHSPEIASIAYSKKSFIHFKFHANLLRKSFNKGIL